MPILDAFRKKKKIEKEKPEEDIKKKKKLEKKVKIPRAESKKRALKRAENFQILKKPHITEKATDLSEKNQYVFEIFARANKTEIKKTIENLYGVDVLAVRVLKTPRKRRKRGTVSGWKKGCKKAIVTVKAGQKIEILPK